MHDTDFHLECDFLPPIHSALKSQYSTSFTRPTEEDMKNLFYCPVKPSHIPTSKHTDQCTTQYTHTLIIISPSPQDDDVSLMQTVPHMYTTTNTTYGGRHIVAAV